MLQYKYKYVIYTVLHCTMHIVHTMYCEHCTVQFKSLLHFIHSLTLQSSITITIQKVANILSGVLVVKGYQICLYNYVNKAHFLEITIENPILTIIFFYVP